MTAAGAVRAVIAGTGVAGAVVACELRRRGFDVWMIETPRAPGAGGIEAVPEAVIDALASVGLGNVLPRAGAVAVHGFDNAWHDAERPVRIDGRWYHVERRALSRALREAALDRGAQLITLPRVPRLTRTGDRESFRWNDPGLPPVARVAVDATGRTAVWSRPLVHRDTKIATLFRGPGSTTPRRGRVTRTSTGWAYALSHVDATSVGVVTAAQPGELRAPIARLPDEVATALEVASPEAFRRDHQCVAHVQWSAQPTSTCAPSARLAVGDAAFACEPIAGQGIRFAIASAVAAAACCETEREVVDDRSAAFQAAAHYYDELVASACRRHLIQLARLAGDDRPVERAVDDDVPLRFSAQIVPTGLRRGEHIVPGVGIRLGDGELVRWLGEFDLLELVALTRSARTARELAAKLQMRGLSSSHAHTLVQWCTARGVLAPYQRHDGQ